MSDDELVLFRGSSDDEAFRDDTNLQLNERRDTRNENFSSQRALPNPNSNKTPSDEELQQEFDQTESGDSGESYSSCSNSNLTIERVCDDKVEQLEAKEDTKPKMQNQLQLCEDF